MLAGPPGKKNGYARENSLSKTQEEACLEGKGRQEKRCLIHITNSSAPRSKSAGISAKKRAARGNLGET